MSTFSVNEKSKAKSADVSRSSSVSSVQVSKSRKIDVLAEFKSKKRGKDNLNLVVVGKRFSSLPNRTCGCGEKYVNGAFTLYFG
jgi:ADP-dependent phosphofructokinase/glucokinase